MPTTVVKTIGTSSRDYSTVQAWEDAAPADLTLTRSNSCLGGTTSTILLDAGASAVDGFYVGHTITNASSEERLCTGYVGATKAATIGALNGSSATWTTPTTGTAFTVNSVIWQGQCYNDAEFVVANAVVTIAGSTSDATRYKELTAASGQSFQDAAGVRTNALKYNVTNGVALRATGNYHRAVIMTENFSRVNRLQLKADGGATETLDVNGTGCQTKNIIISQGSSSNYAVLIGGTNAILANVMVWIPGSSGDGFNTGATGTVFIACTFIRSTDVATSGTAFTAVTVTDSIMKSCAAFGATTPAGGTWGASSSNNATNAASGLPGTSNQHSVTYNSTTPFTNSTVASQNSIPIGATSLGTNGVLDATNAPNDITKLARPSNPTIGVWELVGPATTIPGQFPRVAMMILAPAFWRWRRFKASEQTKGSEPSSKPKEVQ